MSRKIKYIMLSLPVQAYAQLQMGDSDLTAEESAALDKVIEREEVGNHIGSSAQGAEYFSHDHELQDVMGGCNCHDVVFAVECREGEDEKSGNVKEVFYIKNDSDKLLDCDTGEWTGRISEERTSDDFSGATGHDDEADAKDRIARLKEMFPLGDFELVSRYEE